MKTKINKAILSKSVFVALITFLFLICCLNESFSQVNSFEKTENKFSSEKLKNQDDTTKAEKRIVKKKINMKIPVYVGLLTGAVLGVGSFLADKQRRQQLDYVEGAQIEIPPKVILIGGFVFGFAIGFVITGAIMQARLRHPDNDQINNQTNFSTTRNCPMAEIGHRGITLFCYTYKF